MTKTKMALKTVEEEFGGSNILYSRVRRSLKDGGFIQVTFEPKQDKFYQMRFYDDCNYIVDDLGTRMPIRQVLGGFNIL